MILGELYRADVLKRGKFEVVLRRYREMAQADQDLMKELVTHRKFIEPLVKQRGDSSAFVEKKHMEYLDKLMEKQDA